jgi:hypothetical protein
VDVSSFIIFASNVIVVKFKFNKLTKLKTMTTLRRLSNDNVKTIFDCVYNNKKPDDEKLMFQIIVVGSNGMKLSPPSYEFEDGLYILLKPLKKTKNEKCLYTESPQDDPRIPSQLKSMVFLDKPRLVCPWSLSGPQFPVPTSIQQRYCYPKGDKEYSSKKGGALWTTYDESGKEDLDYRLLHVYYSAKRAGNTGRVSSSSLATTSRKKVKESKEKVDVLALSSSPLHMASLASASFDSPLSFLEVPTSPVDPSMFTSMFVKSFSIDSADSADNESIITPDHSIFDMRSSSHNRHYKDPRLPAPPATKNHQRLYSGGAPTPSAHGRRRRGANVSNSSSSSTSVSFPGSQPPLYHYPHSYPYWMPPQSNPPPCHSCSMDSQDRCNMHWGSPPTSMVTHNSKKQHSYPVQESRKQSASTVSYSIYIFSFS